MYCTGFKQALYDFLVLFAERFMIECDTVLQTLHQPLVREVIEMGLKVAEFDVEETIFFSIRRAVRQDVVYGHTALLS